MNVLMRMGGWEALVFKKFFSVGQPGRHRGRGQKFPFPGTIFSSDDEDYLEKDIFCRVNP
jgi:hypothetical protein